MQDDEQPIKRQKMEPEPKQTNQMSHPNNKMVVEHFPLINKKMVSQGMLRKDEFAELFMKSFEEENGSAQFDRNMFKSQADKMM